MTLNSLEVQSLEHPQVQGFKDSILEKLDPDKQK